MRTKRLVLACIVLALLAGPLALWLTAPRPCINQESYDQLRLRMNEQEVETLLGGPAGDYSTKAIPWFEPSRTKESLAHGVEVRRWIEDKATIEVWFDRQGPMFCKRL